MAEGILRDALSPKLLSATEISSAGVGALAGLPASENAVIACEEAGIDIAGHRSRPLTPYLIEESDLILAMEEHHRLAAARSAPHRSGKIRLLSRYATGDEAPPLGVPDPIGGDLEEYRETFEKINEYVRQALPRIEQEILAGAVES